VEMAEQVCSDVRLPAAQVGGLVTGLAAARLIQPSSAGGATDRYRLPGAVRDYAAGRLAAAGEAGQLGRRLRDYAARRVAYLLSINVRVPASWPVIDGVLRSYEADVSNVRAALGWWRDRGDTTAGLATCAELASYWIAVGGMGEGAWWLDAFLDPRQPPAPAAVRGPALAGRAQLACDSGDQRAELWAGAALELCRAAGDDRHVAAALNVLSRTAMGAGRADDALRYATEAVEVCQAAGYAWNQGFALGSQAYALAALGRLPEAMDASQAGLELTRSSGNEWGVARFQVGSGDVARALGDPGGARGYYLAALPFLRDAMPAPDAAGCLARLGSVETRLGDLAAARDCLAEGLRLALAAGHRAALARCLLALATLALREGRPDRAVILDAAATAQSRAAGAPPPPDRRQRYRAALGEAEITRLQAVGGAMTSRAAADYALAAG
jgi:tetratricopeptide (TPR) repeat protein